MSIGVPVKLLHDAQGYIVTIEMKTGELFRGTLESSEDNMNCQILDVTRIRKDGSSSALSHAFIRGSHIRFVILPDILKEAPAFRKDLTKAGRLAGQAESEEKRVHHAGRGGRGGKMAPRARGSTKNHTKEDKDYYITAKLFAENRQIGPEVWSGFGKRSLSYSWKKILTFPVKYQVLPLSTQICFTIWDISSGKSKPLGGTTILIFNKRQILKNGRYKLYIWQGVEADGSIYTKTPYKMHSEWEKWEKVLSKFNERCGSGSTWLDDLLNRSIVDFNINKANTEAMNNRLAFYIEFAPFPYPVVFHQDVSPSTFNYNYLENNGESKSDISKIPCAPRYLFFDCDPRLEINYAEQCHNKQMQIRKYRPHETVENFVKPNSEERDRLEVVISYPSIKDIEDRELVYKFRYYLRSKRKAFTKFLKSVVWQSRSQAYIDEAYDLMEKWYPIDIEDALELLSYQFSQHIRIRTFAVRCLYRADDSEIEDCFLQLFQALRYDHDIISLTGTSKLWKFLCDRTIKNEYFSNHMYWYLTVECDTPPSMSSDLDFFKRLKREWITIMEKEGLKHRLNIYARQEELLSIFSTIIEEVKQSRGSRMKKIGYLHQLFSDSGKYSYLKNFEPLPLPMNPAQKFHGIEKNIYMFNSALMPIKLDLKMESKNHLSIILKMGDDLRQDHLVVNLISLMDKMLKKENLDLKLTPYHVMASSRSLGMIEMVPNSKSIADIIVEDGDLMRFMQKHAPCPASHMTYQIEPSVLKNFVKSCAGYCVITYILGIGDRHLDNLLMTTDGKLFHIDFGFILGRDPKPFPPPMKLSAEMISGMGGSFSNHYKLFKSLACEAYNILRKSGNFILNLISLMINADLYDLNQGERSVLKVQEKLKLDLTDEEASIHLQNLINESVNALMPKMMEKVHSWAKEWRG